MTDFHRRIGRPRMELQRFATLPDHGQTRLPVRTGREPDGDRGTCVELARQRPVKPDTRRLVTFERIEQCGGSTPPSRQAREPHADVFPVAFYGARFSIPGWGCVLCLGSIRAPETTMSKRLFRVYRAAGLALAAAALVACSTASAVKPVPLSQLSNDDQIFVQLREAARNNDPARAAQLAAMIPDYPAPWLSGVLPAQAATVRFERASASRCAGRAGAVVPAEVRRPGDRRPAAQRLPGGARRASRLEQLRPAICALRAERRYAGQVLRARIARGAW